MNAKQAAEFFGMSEAAFRRHAPQIPRCRLGTARFVYLKEDLLDYLRRRREVGARGRR